MMEGKKKILAISGSTKKNSSNASILQFIAEAYKSVLEVQVWKGVELLPHFNPELDGQTVPAVVEDFRNQILLADGVIICTPEYVFSLPGSLKNAIEWTVSTTVFSNKPVAIIVASASGEKAFESLELVMTAIEARIAEGSKLLIRGVKGKVGQQGEINDFATASSLKAVVASLIASIEAENEIPTKYQQLQ